MNSDDLIQYRSLMFSIAYRMTGSVGDAEDKAYLATIATRLAIDHLRSARVRRERAVFYGDSGGNGEVTFIEPVHGRESVARIVIFQLDRLRRLDAHLEPATINGMPGLLAYAADGLIAATTFEVLDGQVQAIRVVANPDKLRHIGPVSSSWHLRAADDLP
jgi:hypothetical protein